MKLLFFSDIHGNNYAFDAFVKNLSNYKSKYKLIFLGDFIGYYYGINEIISYCRENRILCILGNHDKYFLDILDGKLSLEKLVQKYGRSYEIAVNSVTKQNIRFLRQLDKKRILNLANKKIYICHGSPLDNLEGRIYPNTDLSNFETLVDGFNYVVTGHTHHKMIRSYGSTIFLNPGSLGQQRDGKGCSYMTLDLDLEAYHFHTIEYSIKNLEKDIERFDSGRRVLKDVLSRT